jgi:hypothetical protein
MSHSSAAVVRSQEEALVPELSHHFELILRHRAERVVLMPTTAFGLARVAVTSKVGQYDRVSLGKAGRDLVPDGMSLRVPVKEQEGRTRSFAQTVNPRSLGLQVQDLEGWEQFLDGHPRAHEATCVPGATRSVWCVGVTLTR